jgi:hypothetical protein
MLSWTSKGAVSSPAVLQIRMNSAIGGLVAAGAPSPSRAVTLDEFYENLAYFSLRRGSRAVPIERLVLSGIAEDTPVGSLIEAAQKVGVTHTTLHLSAPVASQLGNEIGHANAVVIPIFNASDVATLWAVPSDIFRIAVLQVTQRTAWEKHNLLACLERTPPDLIVITWPYVGEGLESLSTDQVVDVRKAYERLAQTAARVVIKGMPACIVDFCDEVGTKSSNRWYVDSDHQQEEAILFFPNVVRFSKAEACRFCAITSLCDGVPTRWASPSTMRACTPIEAAKKP